MKFTHFLKKIYLVPILALLFMSNVHAEVGSDWYLYKGTADIHTFSLRFPRSWQSFIVGNNIQGVSPFRDQILFKIQEFKNQTYDEAINSYLNDNISHVSTKDEVIITPTEDLVLKRVIFKNNEKQQDFGISFIQRGSSIFSLTEPNLEGSVDFPYSTSINPVINDIYRSFTFTDGWRQFIDYRNGFTFTFPSNLKLANLRDSVKLSISRVGGGKLFKIEKLGEVDFSTAEELVKKKNDEVILSEEAIFNGIEPAKVVTYRDKVKQKRHNMIFIEKNGKVFALTDINIEENFPHNDFYDSYIREMLTSFYFFNAPEGYSPFTHFSDVRDDHPNAKSINSLKEVGIIDGYGDGFFHPDGTITRAELTKLVVTVRKRPEAFRYNSCFSDVSYEWFAPYVCYAKEQKWLTGREDGSFGPYETVTRAEALKIILGSLVNDQVSEEEDLIDKGVKDITPQDWFYKFFIFADNNQLLDKQHVLKDESGGYSYLPLEMITRKEVCELLYSSGTFIKPL